MPVPLFALFAPWREKKEVSFAQRHKDAKEVLAKTQSTQRKTPNAGAALCALCALARKKEVSFAQRHKDAKEDPECRCGSLLLGEKKETQVLAQSLILARSGVHVRTTISLHKLADRVVIGTVKLPNAGPRLHI